MRINSKHKDYYDSVLQYGMNSQIVYNRFRRIENFSDVRESEKLSNIVWAHLPSMARITINREKEQFIEPLFTLIGFCGELVPILKFNYYSAKRLITSTTRYESLGAMSYLDKLKRKYKKLYYDEEFYGYGRGEFELAELNSWFNIDLGKEKFHEFFQFINAPVFVLVDRLIRVGVTEEKEIHNRSNCNFIVSNISLKDYEFYRYKNEVNCFQEIAQYISGVLTSTEKNDHIRSDKEKIQSHGFDLKYGFRTRPKK